MIGWLVAVVALPARLVRLYRLRRKLARIERALQPVAKRGGYQPTTTGPAPTSPPPKPSDAGAWRR